MDDWTWQELTPHTVAGGRGWYTGAVFTSGGVRVASIAQETLFRTSQPARRGGGDGTVSGTFSATVNGTRAERGTA